MDTSPPRQLWLLRGDRPVIWTVPVWVTIFLSPPAEPDPNAQAPARCLLELALTLRPAQLAHVAQLLRLSGAAPAGHAWSLPLIQLPKIADPIAGPDLEAFYSWGKPQLAQQDRFKPELRRERDAFLDALYAKGVGQSRNQLEITYNHLCNHMVDWLLNCERPVDLYFATLWPCPYRLDWKSRLRKRLHNNGVPLSRFPDVTARQPAIQHELLQPRLLAASQRRFVRRYIELELSPTWTKLAARVEEWRLRILGRSNYARYTFGRVRAWLPHALRLLTLWLASVSDKSAAVVSPRVGRYPIIIPEPPPGSGLPDRVGVSALLATALFPEKPGLPSALSRPAGHLRRVPPLQPPPPVLRHPGSVLPKP